MNCCHFSKAVHLLCVPDHITNENYTAGLLLSEACFMTHVNSVGNCTSLSDSSLFYLCELYKKGQEIFLDSNKKFCTLSCIIFSEITDIFLCKDFI